MNNIPNNINKEIIDFDYIKYCKIIWQSKKTIFKICGISTLIGIIVAFSIPKEYTTTVTLASEVTKSSSTSSVAALASMAGINIGSSNSRDALSPLIYPEVVSSTPFLTELFNREVQTIDGTINTTVEKYLLENQKSPWWNYIFSMPSRFVSYILSFFKKNDIEPNIESNKIDTFNLTKRQYSVIGALKQRISVEVNKKTAVITLRVTMQDPLISATLANILINNLQEYITKYRTSKAKIDLEFAEKLFEESKEEYYKAQEEYAHYIDNNQNISLKSIQAQGERLENEMRLKYSVYNQAAQQLQLAKAKLQENTPIYAIIQSASIPLKASKPSKMFTIMAFIFMGALASISLILLRNYKKINCDNK